MNLDIYEVDLFDENHTIDSNQKKRYLEPRQKKTKISTHLRKVKSMEKNVLQAKLVCKRVIGNLDSTFVLSVFYPYAYGSPINRVSSGELWGLEPSHGPGYSSKTRASHIKYPIRLRSAQNC